MDRKGLIGVVLCLIAYVGLTAYLNTKYPPHKALPAPSASTAPATTSAPPELNAAPGAAPATASSTEKPATSGEPEKLNVLENDVFKITFTTQGAAIKQVELKNHAEGDGLVTLNKDSHENVLAVDGWPGADATAFQVQSTPTTITYTATLPGSVTWKRTYTIGKEYEITVQDAFANAGSAQAVLPTYALSLGRAKPLLVKGQYQSASSQYVGAGWLTTDKFHLTTISAFNPTSTLGFNRQPGKDVVSTASVGDTASIRWVAVQDQFFAVLLTPDRNHPITQANFQCFSPRGDGGYYPPSQPPDIEATATFPEIRIPAGQQTAVNYSLYAGPREYGRLNALGEDQGELMNYDGMLPFHLLIVPMLDLLHWFNGYTHSYGVAIILLTLVIKAVTWPLQSFANRSGKRMQALAPKIKELQAKYKDQPEKLNSETFGLYKKYGVNPFGGCLPAFIQMPVFFSLYYMLQNAVELRGQHFLWVKDLTQPDTIFSMPLPLGFISHLVINPLPVMVTGLMFIMMRMTPQLGDPQQQKIAQFMPLFFLFLFYNFAAALSLYYVINNSVAIIQIYRNLKKPLPELRDRSQS